MVTTVDEKNLRQRIVELVSQADSLLIDKEDISYNAPQKLGAARALVDASISITKKYLPSTDTYAQVIAATRLEYASDRDNRIILARLRDNLASIEAEANLDLLRSVIASAQAIVFDDFIDHAEAYLKISRFIEAAAIASIAFEDVVRRLCEKHGIDPTGKTLDSRLNALKAENVLSKIEGKRCVAFAEIRNSAAHADWEHIDESFVRELIEFLRSTLIVKFGS
jgi:hypothetical protein